MKKNNYILLFLVAFIFIACGNKNKTIVESVDVYDTISDVCCNLAYNAEQLSAKLDKYCNNADSLDMFFSEWNKSIEANSEQFIKANDTLTNIYAVYKAFYKPDTLYKDVKYIIVPNTLSYYVVDSLNDDNTLNLKTIKNFRPILEMDRTKILYLANEYEIAIKKFINAGERGMYDENRCDILSKYIHIFIHHNSKSLNMIATRPYVIYIGFNNKFDEAILTCSSEYTISFDAVYKKINGTWQFQENKNVAVE